MKEMKQLLSLCSKKWSLQLQQPKAITMILKGLASFYGRDFPHTKPSFVPFPSPSSEPTWLAPSWASWAPRYSWAEQACPGGHVRGQTWGRKKHLCMLCLKPSAVDLAAVPSTPIINYISILSVYTGFLFIMKYLLQGSASAVRPNSSVYCLCRENKISP